MKLMTRIAFAALLTTGFSLTAQATDVQAAPAPAQDPIVQHLKLTSDQVAKIKSLHQQLENNVQQISQQDIKDGALINVIDSGKWDEKAVKDQLAAFSKIDQQVRYYRVKYYFDVNQVLTPEQRTQVKKDLADALSEYVIGPFRGRYYLQAINENRIIDIAFSGETFFIPQTNLRFDNNGFQFAQHLIITKADDAGGFRLRRG